MAGWWCKYCWKNLYLSCNVSWIRSTGVAVGNRFGQGTGKIWLDDVNCRGYETSLKRCRHAGWGEHNCQHSDDVSIMCYGGVEISGMSMMLIGVATIKSPERASAVHIFLLRNLVKCGICYAKVCLSFCPSVRPSVTLVSHALTVQYVEICFAPHDRETFLVSGHQMCNTESRGCGRNDCVKQRHPLATAKMGSVIHHISETCEIRT